MGINRDLLTVFVKNYPFQPATAFWRAIEIEHLLQEPFPAGKGLDLGCGDGKLTKIILDRVGERHMTGIDIDPMETALAKETGVYQNIHVGPGDSVPEDSSSFDFVLSNSVLEHIPNILDVLSEVSRVLKSGGQFLFTVPSDQFHQCLRGPLLPWCNRQKYLEKLDRRLLHLHYFSKERWQEELSVRGFTIKSFRGCLNEKEMRRWETLSRLTGGLLHNLMGKDDEIRPIHIQRSMGMRSKKTTTPSLVVSFLSIVLSLGFNHNNTNGKLNGVYIIAAEKK